MPTPFEIVVVGSANLDLVVAVDQIPLAGETVMGGDLRRIPGGKGANQAVAAARLGRQVALVGRVGDDEGGAILRSALHDDGVDISEFRTIQGVPSGVALISVADDGDNAIVVSPGANSQLSAADIRAVATVLAEAAVVLLQLEVPIDAVTEAARLAGGTVVLNPAPALEGQLPADLMDETDIIVPNQTELATLTGYDGVVDAETAVDLARRLPVDAVVVTLGAQGALVVQGGSALHITAAEVDPVDTTAAGDSFCAALADALVGGATVSEATRWAVRVGAATTLRPGAQPSLPTRDEVDRLIPS